MLLKLLNLSGWFWDVKSQFKFDSETTIFRNLLFTRKRSSYLPHPNLKCTFYILRSVIAGGSPLHILPLIRGKIHPLTNSIWCLCFSICHPWEKLWIYSIYVVTFQKKTLESYRQDNNFILRKEFKYIFCSNY